MTLPTQKPHLPIEEVEAKAQWNPARHSPLPWSLDGRYIKPTTHEKFGRLKLTSPWIEGAWDNDEEAKANAAFIVTAVNAYEKSQKRIAELEARVAELEAQNQWQPIETAPSGTEIIMVSDGQQVWTTWRVIRDGEFSCRKYGWKLAHWRPLPTPPVAANDNGGQDA